MGDDAQSHLQEDQLRPSPPPPLTSKPSLETTPPPGNPRDDFGIGTTPDYQGLGPLHPGQTLIVYHPFAEHHSEVVNTADLLWTQELATSPPSEEPWAPFKTRVDFEQAELFLHHNCPDSMINNQLQLNHKVSPGVQTMKNAYEMHKILAEAGQHQNTSSVGLFHLL